jgi:thioredoxin-related protein
MKKFLVLFCFTLSLFASSLSYETNYFEAMKKAKEENKDLIVFMYSENCPWCTKMENTTLSNTKVIDKINENYIFVAINPYVDIYPPQLRPNGVPTTYIINSEYEELTSTMRGYTSTNKILSRLK